MFVLGTAGHVDHGKSALVQALTGIDPDRLREEKERGMTIDLGFAWLKLPSGQEVGIVDIPGHEHFIKNMLAGVGGLDLALLIVAANEGIMPQTREHLAILDLLEIKRGIVVITKKDLVDEEWLTLVRMEVEELIASTTLAKSPIIAVSAITREGLPELVAAIDKILSTTEPRKDIGRPRLSIDRIFTIAGSGTVVTGTLIDGSLGVGQEVEIVPAGVKARIRGLQTHKTRLNEVTPGSRVAVNLAGVNVSQVQRGDVLTRPDWLTPTARLTARLRLISDIPRPLRHGVTVSFHSGSAESLARVRLLEKEELKPGETGWIQLLLDRPLAVVKGDRFTIRSPEETLGGGEVIETQPKLYRRFRPQVIQSLEVRQKGSPEEILLALLESKQPLEQRELVAQSNLPDAEKVIMTLVRQGGIVVIEEKESRLLFTKTGWQRLAEKAVALAGDYHRRYPVRLGIQKGELSSRLGTGDRSRAILQRMIDTGVLSDEGTVVRLPAHQPQLTPAQKAKVDAFLKSLADNPYSPPGDAIPEPDLLNLLIERGQVVKVSSDVVFSTDAYNRMVEKVVAHLKANGKITLAEVRDMFKSSRKYIQAFLEYLDEKKITRRVGDERVLGQ